MFFRFRLFLKKLVDHLVVTPIWLNVLFVHIEASVIVPTKPQNRPEPPVIPNIEDAFLAHQKPPPSIIQKDPISLSLPNANISSPVQVVSKPPQDPAVAIQTVPVGGTVVHKQGDVITKTVQTPSYSSPAPTSIATPVASNNGIPTLIVPSVAPVSQAIQSPVPQVTPTPVPQTVPTVPVQVAPTPVLPSPVPQTPQTIATSVPQAIPTPVPQSIPAPTPQVAPTVPVQAVPSAPAVSVNPSSSVVPSQIYVTPSGQKYYFPQKNTTPLSSTPTLQQPSAAQNKRSANDAAASSVPDEFFEKNVPKNPKNQIQNWVDPDNLPTPYYRQKYDPSPFQKEAALQGYAFPDAPVVKKKRNVTNQNSGSGQNLSSALSVGNGYSTEKSQYALSIEAQRDLQDRIKLEALQIESTLLNLEKKELEQKLAQQLNAQLEAQKQASQNRQKELDKLKQNVLKSLEGNFKQKKEELEKVRIKGKVHRKDYDFKSIHEVRRAEAECGGRSQSSCKERSEICLWRKKGKKHKCTFSCKDVSIKHCKKLKSCMVKNDECRHR